MKEMPNATHDDNIERLARESERQKIQLEMLTEELTTTRSELMQARARIAELEAAAKN